jgi:hypothetical protein
MSGNNKQQVEEPTTEPAAAPLTRDQIREKVFGAKAESKIIDFFGAQVELRQPTVGVTMEMRQGTPEQATSQMLINYTFVPGTQEKVFEEADAEAIMQLPFGPDMNRYTTEVNKLVGISTEGLEKLVGNAMKRAGDGAAQGNGDVDSGGAS